MKKTYRRRLRIALTVLMLLFLGLTLRQVWGYYQVMRTTDEARQLAGIPVHTQAAPEKTPEVTAAPVTTPQQTLPPPSQPAETQPPVPVETQPDPLQLLMENQLPLAENAGFLLDVDLTQLRQVNPEVIGWIHIHDTRVSYPLLQAQDNAKYLERAWDGTESRAGSIFLECQNSPDLQDFNTIIYGHHMRNGSCFADIIKYRKEQYREDHPEVYIVTEDQVRRYQVFAAYEAPLDSDAYRMRLQSASRRAKALEFFQESSVWESPLVPDVNDWVLTLSTCKGNGTYETRWVVQAVLTGVFPRDPA